MICHPELKLKEIKAESESYFGSEWVMRRDGPCGSNTDIFWLQRKPPLFFRKTSRNFQCRSGVQDQVGWGLGQPDLVPGSVVGIPACRGV